MLYLYLLGYVPSKYLFGRLPKLIKGFLFFFCIINILRIETLGEYLWSANFRRIPLSRYFFISFFILLHPSLFKFFEAYSKLCKSQTLTFQMLFNLLETLFVTEYAHKLMNPVNVSLKKTHHPILLLPKTFYCHNSFAIMCQWLYSYI